MEECKRLFAMKQFHLPPWRRMNGMRSHGITVQTHTGILERGDCRVNRCGRFRRDAANAAQCGRSGTLRGQVVALGGRKRPGLLLHLVGVWQVGLIARPPGVPAES